MTTAQIFDDVVEMLALEYARRRRDRPRISYLEGERDRLRRRLVNDWYVRRALAPVRVDYTPYIDFYRARRGRLGTRRGV